VAEAVAQGQDLQVLGAVAANKQHDEDLEILGSVAAGELDEQLDGAAERQVGESWQHRVASTLGAGEARR